MAYYKVKDRQLVLCPKNVILERGSVFNYNLLPGPVLEADGWKPALVDDPFPEYNPDTQELIPWYEDCGTYIARRWEVAALPQPTSEQMARALEILGVKLNGEEIVQE